MEKLAEPASDADDVLQFVDDSLDSHPCMLPLVHLVEKGATLVSAGKICVHLASRLLQLSQWLSDLK